MRLRLAAAALAMGAVVAHAAGPAPRGTDARRSGYDFMTPQVQAMQNDDATNPATLSVQEGAALWEQPAGTRRRSCMSCHGAAATSMRGVAARYPAFDAALGRPIDLGERIDRCRIQHQGAPAFAHESPERLAIESFIALQSRGMPVAPGADARLEPARARGERLFTRRIGQLDFSCAQCHDDHAGQRLGGSVIPQAHPTGYPLYRLEWQGMGSLQRRLRSCMAGVRAEPFAYGAPELVELELYLKQRAAGMKLDAPAVRP